jgi:Flp pilus assembly CpaE family ATPase
VEQSDVVLVVTQMAVGPIHNATRLYQGLLGLGTPEGRVRFVVNRYRKNFGQIELHDIEQHFGQPVFAILPNDFSVVSRALDQGHALMADAPNSPIRQAMCDLAERILGSEEAKAGKGPKASILARIFAGG